MSNQRPNQRATRPANRPSRRHEIGQAAEELFSLHGPDGISVSDIASRCGMTPAAFYYHYSSKEEILLEIVEQIAEQWIDVASAGFDDVSRPEDLAAGCALVLDWVRQHPQQARLYFVTSVGATSATELVRRRTRTALARRVTRRLIGSNLEPDRVRAALAGVALITLLEVAARSISQDDPRYEVLDAQDFLAVVSRLALLLIADPR
jgi:AcrR family transcriptional regulator